jgi:hypothetical protein
LGDDHTPALRASPLPQGEGKCTLLLSFTYFDNCIYVPPPWEKVFQFEDETSARNFLINRIEKFKILTIARKILSMELEIVN